jgi:hypothetical protein
MRKITYTLVFIGAAFCVYAEKDSCKIEKPAMELGGLVTVDYAGQRYHMKEAQIQIGSVELGATVNICDEVKAAITIKAENDLTKMWIDQAMALYTPSVIPNFEAIFGQFTFNHGILTTYLISDPLINDEVEFIKPGIAFNYALGNFKPGLGFTIIHTDADKELGTQLRMILRE